MPQIENVGSGLAVGVCWHAVAAGAENDIDLVVGGEEPLRLARRLEPPHQLFAFPGWPMGAFNAIVQSRVRPVVRVRGEITDRHDIAAQFVCDYTAWIAETGHQPFHETSSRFDVSMRLSENVQNVTVCINCSPEAEFHASDRHDNFVQVPFVRRCRAVTSNTIRKVVSKSVHPLPDSLPTDDHSAFRQKVFNIRRAQAEVMVGPNCLGDDLVRETVAFQARHVGWHFDPRHLIENVSRSRTHTSSATTAQFEVNGSANTSSNRSRGRRTRQLNGCGLITTNGPTWTSAGSHAQ